jgi:hypothetical protein
MVDLLTSNGGNWGYVNKNCNYLIGASWVASRKNFKSAINYNIPIVTEGKLIMHVSL